MQKSGQNNLVTKATMNGNVWSMTIGSRARLSVEVAKESLYQGVDAKVLPSSIWRSEAGVCVSV